MYLQRRKRRVAISIIRETILTIGTEDPTTFVTQVVEFMTKSEKKFAERIRGFYIEDGAEVLKGVRLPVQVLAENMDWDIDRVRGSHSLKTELGL